MLSEGMLAVLKANRIDADDVENVDGSMLVTFKDGTQRRICEVWTRCMGYHRPSSEFNKGKYSEFKDRKYFTEIQAIKQLDNTPEDAA